MIQNSVYIRTFVCNTPMVYLFIIIIFLILGHLEASGTKSISPILSLLRTASLLPLLLFFFNPIEESYQ